jgi:hypothetical protein
MDIKHFTEEYTCGKTYFKDVLAECKELFDEIVKFNKEGMKEEFADVVVFIQIWLWNKFKLNGKLWSLGKSSFDKFIKRRKVWEQIYQYVGIKQKCTICKNYVKSYKIVRHLKTLGISEKKALQAYQEVVLKL